jgi:hypothetical protein
MCARWLCCCVFITSPLQCHLATLSAAAAAAAAAAAVLASSGGMAPDPDWLSPDSLEVLKAGGTARELLDQEARTIWDDLKVSH